MRKIRADRGPGRKGLTRPGGNYYLQGRYGLKLMVFTEKEMREDLRKVRIRKYLYLGGGLLILALGVALFVLFITRMDWAAFALSLIGLFWSIMLYYHFMRTRALEALIRNRVEGAGDEGESGEAAGEELEVKPDRDGAEVAGRGPEGGRSG